MPTTGRVSTRKLSEFKRSGFETGVRTEGRAVDGCHRGRDGDVRHGALVVMFLSASCRRRRRRRRTCCGRPYIAEPKDGSDLLEPAGTD